MRDIDRAECEAMGRSGKAALRTGLAVSQAAWTALVDGRPEAVFGVVVDNAMTGEGTPWFLGTDEVYRQGRALLMWGPAFVARLHDSSRALSNLVSADNLPAIRLLARWGFVIEENTVEIGGMAFRRFTKVAA